MPKDKLNRLNNSTTLSKKKVIAKGWVSQSEAARLRGVSPQAIGRLIKKGRFRTLQIAGKILLNRREVLNYKAKPTGRPRK
jgi:hypothetical protein